MNFIRSGYSERVENTFSIEQLVLRTAKNFLILGNIALPWQFHALHSFIDGGYLLQVDDLHLKVCALSTLLTFLIFKIPPLPYSFILVNVRFISH